VEEYDKGGNEMKKEHIFNPTVQVIPATKRHVENGDQFRKQNRLRVAAYCRVSTEEESQENSYAVQKSHYTTLILSRSGWELAGIYADEGKSGTTRKGRSRFNELISDCREGKVDYIITKSISRFARNTSDALNCVHELQRLHPPVGIYFERENIDTLNANSEMFLTFYCSMAQEESHSISENIKWSLQKNFRSGQPQINLRRMLGYDLCRDGSWEINPAEAEIVRYIYQCFLNGSSANAIAKELNQQGKQTVNGKIWRSDAILYILRNEKYVGDLLMQKTYTESFLTHKSVKNTGEYPQYFRENHHPAIIQREMWNKTQELIACRQRKRRHQTNTIQTQEGAIEIGVDQPGETSQEKVRMLNEVKSAGRGKGHAFWGMTCAICGREMRRMIYHLSAHPKNRAGEAAPEKRERSLTRSTVSYAVWKCPASAGKHGTVREGCTARTLTEIGLEQSFMEMLYCIQQDVAEHGENADIKMAFQQTYHALQRADDEAGFLREKLELLSMEIAELEKSYETAIEHEEIIRYAEEISFGDRSFERGRNTYIRVADELKKRLMEKRQEEAQLRGNSTAAEQAKKQFQSFLHAIELLPKITCTEENAQKAPAKMSGTALLKPLIFDEQIFRTYILHMEVEGDAARYQTSFGVTLASTGNGREIRPYIGYG
jgi:DNA invertase Pin-like site-specific DNA recombinase